MKISKKLHPFMLTMLAVMAGIGAYLFGIPFLDVMELKTIDLRFESRGSKVPGPEVVLAVIDEKSIAREGKWIWPRSKIAELVNRLSAYGAKVVAFDIGFLEPDENAGGRVIEQIIEKINTSGGQNQAIQNYLKKLKSESDNDRRLADAIRNSSAKVVLGYFFQMAPHGSDQLSAEEYHRHQENVKGSRYQFVRFKSDNARKVKLMEPALPQSNITAISEATDYAGFFNMEADRDGVVRWIPAVFKYKDTLYAPLAVMAAGAFLDSPPSLQVADYGIESLQVDRISIPVDELGRIMINYRGGAKTYPHISVTDILNGNVAEADLRDKIVIVGATAVGIYDLRVTPFSSVYPGVEIHANIIDNILSKNFLYQPSWAAVFDIFGIIATGLILGFILPRTGVFTGILSSLMVFAGYIFVCQLFFTQKGFILNLVYPLAVLLMVYVIITAYKYLVESRQKRFIKDAFSTYLAPSVVKQLIDSPEKLVLGGEKRVITAFFSDVQGFTSISEKLSPEKLVEILNEFLTEMTDIILKDEGTVDKFEGDAIIAFFGAPNELENHAATACAASIEMQKKLAKLRAKWKAEGKSELMMRIGLCSGAAVVGNMGSKNRMDYTMMGDTVNTAARLEGVNKVYGTYTLVSDTTCHAAGQNFIFREIDKINVVGKKEPITIYQLLGYAGESDERMDKVRDFYARGLKAYQSREWEQAIGFFNEVLKIAPEDGPSLSLRGRCQTLHENPPGKDWNGAFVIKHK
ncbi:MAG: adenylate/guanylate cyclase domain-containing protein [Desulfobacterales bacterium]|nr:adenylate/guanylate cyclase domain-containing protein [Desulfobacterales bacterium]